MRDNLDLVQKRLETEFPDDRIDVGNHKGN